MEKPPMLEVSGPFSVGMIWAEAHGGVIGAGGTLAWHIPEDLAHFKAVTNGHAVLHGRKSYEALPERFRPLPGRRNVVLTKDRNYLAHGAEVVHSFEEAAALLEGSPVWIVGGGAVYSETMRSADVLVVTEVDLDVEGDTFAPPIDREVWLAVQQTPWTTSRTGIPFRVLEYRRR